MEGNAQIIKLIARDEALHLTGTQHMINLLLNGQNNFSLIQIAEECKQDCFDLFRLAAEISSYLVGQINNEVKTDDFNGFDL